MADPEYKRAMNECFNSYPTEQGAWIRRPGFRQVGYTRGAKQAKLIPLSGLTKNFYNMELSDGHIRFTNGARFVNCGITSSLSSFTSANPGVFTTATAHGLGTDDQIYFIIAAPADQLALAPLTNAIFSVEVLDPTTFVLHDQVTGKSLDTSALVWSASYTVTLTCIVDVTTSYTGTSWQQVKRVQSDKGVLLLHPAIAPQFLTYTDNGSGAWSATKLAAAVFRDGPYLDPQVGSVATPTGTAGIVTLAFSYTAWSAATAYDVGAYVTSGGSNYISTATANVNNTPASGSAFWMQVGALDFLPQKSFTATDVGRHVRLFSEPAAWAVGASYVDGDLVTYSSSLFGGNTYWRCVLANTGAKGSKEPGAPVGALGNSTIYWVPSSSAARWTWGKITSTAGGVAIVPSSNALNTLIGNMTGSAGLSDIMSGTNDQTKEGSGGGADGYAGVHLNTPSVCTGVQVYPPKSAGRAGGSYTFFTSNNYGNATVNLRGKHTVPSSASNGTLLGSSATFAQGSIPSVITIISTDTVTAWEYLWVEIVMGGGVGGGNATCSGAVLFSSGVGGGSALMQVLGDPLLYSGVAVNTWRLGLFNDTDPVYPTAGCFYGGRIWLGVGKNRFVASAPNDIFNMKPTEPDGTVDAGCGINYSFNSNITAPIQWMYPTDQGIVLGLSGAERLLYSVDQNSAIAANNANVELKTSYGSLDIEPVTSPLTVLFVHANGRDVHEYMRDAFSGRFVVPPLTDNSKSLTATGVSQLAYQRAITPILWACTNEGKLVGSTYDRLYLPFRSESPPKYNGWHHHQHGKNRNVVSVGVGPGVTGSPVEALSIISYDTEDGRYRIEVADDLPPESNDIYDCDLLDNMPVLPPGASGQCGSSTSTTVVIQGLRAYEGERLGVFLAGLDCGDYPVSSGTITVPVGDGKVAGGYLTDRYLTQVSAMGRNWGLNTLVLDGGVRSVPCVFGYRYSSQGQLVRPVAPADVGTTLGPGFGKKKRLHGAALLLVSTGGMSIGSRFDMLMAMGNNPTLPAGEMSVSPTELFTGVWQDTINAENDYDGMLCWQVDGPYTARVCAAGGFIHTEE